MVKRKKTVFYGEKWLKKYATLFNGKKKEAIGRGLKSPNTKHPTFSGRGNQREEIFDDIREKRG